MPDPTKASGSSGVDGRAAATASDPAPAYVPAPRTAPVGPAGDPSPATLDARDEGAAPLLRGWPAVVTVAISIFLVVTTEMLPVGLLTSMGAALHVSDGTAGLAMTLPGFVVALSSPLLALAAGRHDRRLALCALMALLAVANLLCACAHHFAVLLIARFLIGLTIGGIWPIALGIAARLVPAKSVHAATAVIFSGISVGFVLGVPLGTFIGDLAGWRVPFLVMGVLSLGVVAALAVLLPPLPAVTPVLRLTQLPGLLRNTRLRTGLVITALLVTGHFGAYTYLRPVLEEVSAVSSGMISPLLLVYGLAGIAGNFLAGARAHRDPRGTLMMLAGVLAASVLLLPVLDGATAGVVILLAGWGLAYGGVSVSAQAWMLRAAPDTGEVASALFISVFNASIALGALLGGRIADRAALSGVLWLGGTLAALALVHLWLVGARTMPRQN